ncbi:MAG: HAD-IIIA family hydrolase [Candidatus Omnitrophica bacterium]|nr:HAD-IIIA family hydrolase [Candidatus Omnitrophota bacterium]
MDRETIEKAKNIRLLVLDVDGVLTRGEIIYDDRGRQIKIFNVKDGLGVYLLRRSGIETVILTARKSRLLKFRAREMGIKKIFSGFPKEKEFRKILRHYKILPREICFVGDDIIDIKVAEQVGFSVAVGDAVRELKEVCDYTTRNRGGEGAVREVVEIILKAKDLWHPFAYSG